MTMLDSGPHLDTTPKTDSSNRHISLPADVAACLAAQREEQRQGYQQQGIAPPHDLVFTSEVGTFLLPRNLSRVYKTLMTRAAVPQVTFYDPRHWWHASMLIAESWDIVKVARRLGHIDPSITLRIYSHLINQHRQLDALSLDKVLPATELEPAYLN